MATKITDKECIAYAKKHGLPERIDFAMLTVYSYKGLTKGYKKPIGAVRAAIRSSRKGKGGKR